MTHGFMRVGAAAPRVKIADCEHNRKEILTLMRKAAESKCEILVLPELCVTGATCGDLFLFPGLIAEAQKSLEMLAKESAGLDVLAVVGLPYMIDGYLSDCAAAVYKGGVVYITGKEHLDSGEERFFVPFRNEQRMKFKGADISIAIGGDVYAANLRSDAALVLNPSAEYETAGAGETRRRFAEQKSLRSVCGYVRAGAGAGESSTDAVFSGHCIIAEYGEILAETAPFGNGFIFTDIDLGFVTAEQIARKCPVGLFANDDPPAFALERKFSKTPFVPADAEARGAEVLAMQCAGLEQRLRHIGVKDVVLGFSGGLDSALALIAAVKTFDNMRLPRSGVCAVSMPCFGTSERTRGNARALAEALGCTFIEIPIKEAVTLHFKDIGHDINSRDLTYENAQARERTQVVMDLAGERGGIALGTGDMSELALGFATYNGDHMSMYGVNSSVPKTLIPSIIQSFGRHFPGNIRNILNDIVDTPVSPELLPPDENTGETQETERIVGPYLLHDFFLYHFLWRRADVSKILFVAKAVFSQTYTEDEIRTGLDIFMRRFYANQFKRSCSPDGPRVFERSLSPRGGLVMPSDAKYSSQGLSSLSNSPPSLL